MEIEEIQALAAEVAVLLPDAPSDGDTLNWLCWRELVWDAARRIGDLGGDVFDRAGFATGHDCGSSHVSSAEILGLASMFRGQSNLETQRPAF